MAGVKERIKLFDRAADELAVMVAEYEGILPEGFKYITDRLSITVGEIRNVSESLTQSGVPDEELFTALGIDNLPVM